MSVLAQVSCFAERYGRTIAVAADLIWKGIVRPARYCGWQGRVVVLAAENDPTQRDFPHYERLFGRHVERMSRKSGQTTRCGVVVM